MLLPAPLLLSALLACGGTSTKPGGSTATDTGAAGADTGPVDTGPPPTDDDQDGWFTPDDCNDGDPEVNPDATEVCDDIDNDCNGIIDVNDAIDATTWYQDGDGDGYGDPERVVDACNQPPGFVLGGEDCADDDPLTNPSAEEICNDGADNNCNGDDSECTLAGELVLDAADALWTGVSSGDQAGFALAAAGDVDGDGLDDFLVGAPQNDTGASNGGSVYVVFGPAPGGVLSEGGATWSATDSGENAGIAVAGPGDLNGDGYADVLVGSYHADVGGNDSGGVYVVLGPTSGSNLLLTGSDAVLEGELSYDYAGLGVAGGSDLTGDGLADVLVGASGQGEGSSQSHGRAYVMSGPTSGTLQLADAAATLDGTESYDRVSRVAHLGDFDGDGVADLAVGAYTWPDNDAYGGVFLYSGPVTGALTIDDADATWEGEQEDGQAGWALAAGGDIDGDGKGDVVIGAPEADGEASEGGVAYVVLGGADSGSLVDADLRFSGTEDRANLGYSVAGGGDADNDGLADVLLGSVAADTSGTDAGGAWLFYGPTAGSYTPDDADLLLYGANSRDEAGTAVSFAGNPNGDCCDDVLVGAVEADDNGSGSGTVYLIFGVGL